MECLEIFQQQLQLYLQCYKAIISFEIWEFDQMDMSGEMAAGLKVFI
jgi:hypothetical protein